MQLTPLIANHVSATASALITLFAAFRFLLRGNIDGHRKAMQYLYVGTCVVAGGFTLLPGRYLGNVVLGQWLGLV